MTVSELTARIRNVLEPNFDAVDVEGEVSNIHRASSGHLYFTLKDQAAMIQAVSFNYRSAGQAAKNLTAGMQVRITGRITLYSKRGSYQIVCATIVEIGSGTILAMLEQRKQQLASEGLFDTQHKQDIPRFVQSIAILTSPHGAAIRDFLEVTRRRNDTINIIVVPCLVQGEEAAGQICERLAYINARKLAEVIVITRGGGSLEDLLPFSDEGVVRAVFASDIPVVAAIGHEIDTALCELAADMRASTPSVAAELISVEKRLLLKHLSDIPQELRDTLTDKIQYLRNMLTHYNPERLQQVVNRTLNHLKLTLDGKWYELQSRLNELLTRKRSRLESYRDQLHLLSPLAILQRGFAIVQEVGNGSVVSDSSTQKIGNKLAVHVAKGNLTVQVTDIDGNADKGENV